MIKKIFSLLSKKQKSVFFRVILFLIFATFIEIFCLGIAYNLIKYS